MKKLKIFMLSFVLLFLMACNSSPKAIPSTEKTTNVETETITSETQTESATETQTELITETETIVEPVESDMTVHFLDVGQGLAILVQSDNQTLVFDGGDRNTSSFVVAYLKEQGVNKIDYLISSHYDADHVAGLIGCLNVFDVNVVIGSDYVHDSNLYTSFMDAVSAKSLQVTHPAVGEQFTFGTGSFTVLAPAQIGSSSNDNSIAIKITNGSNSFVFTGDAESASESDMVVNGLDLNCDVLSIAHHGSASSTSYAFLEATVPEFAVISAGTNNQYGHPHADTMDKLNAMEISVYRNDIQGTIIAHSDGSVITWSQEPCNDYSAGDSNDIGTQAEVSVSIETPVETSPSETAPSIVAWLSATGSKYHSINNCGNMNPSKARQTTVDAASGAYEPCNKCW